jgi:AcrR family transcriptional regulator
MSGQRQSRAETKSALLTAGVQILVERGLDAGLNPVTLNDAIRASDVPRASAYRLFAEEDADPQDAFRVKLVLSFVADDPLKPRREALVEIIADLLQELNGHSPAERASKLRQVVRQSLLGTRSLMAGDKGWAVVAPMWASTALSPNPSPEMVDSLRVWSRARTFTYLPIWKQLAADCGFRLRPGIDWLTFCTLVRSSAAMEWIGGANHPQLRRIQRPTGPDGALQDWSLSGIVVEGLLLSCIEPDPEAEVEVGVDARSWLEPVSR